MFWLYVEVGVYNEDQLVKESGRGGDPGSLRERCRTWARPIRSLSPDGHRRSGIICSLASDHRLHSSTRPFSSSPSLAVPGLAFYIGADVDEVFERAEEREEVVYWAA